MAKSRINPKKEEKKEGERELSIPEAELMAAYIGTLMADTIATAMEPLGIHLKIYLWSDSQIIQFWILKSEGHPRPFITNRVKKIREFNRGRSATWKYVPTDQNPADIISRGASFKELQNSTIWKNGPSWLPNQAEWPVWSVEQYKTSPSLHLAQGVEGQQPKDAPKSDLAFIINPSKYRWKILIRLNARRHFSDSV